MIRDRLHRAGFGLRVRAEVWQTLADFSATGLELGAAIETTAAIYRDRGDRSVAHILGELRRSLGAGAMRPAIMRYAPDDALMFSGEGRIEAAPMFAGAAKIARGRLTLRRAVRSALAGPLLAVLALVGLYYILGASLFPAVRELAPPERWPLYAKVIHVIAGGVHDHILIAAPSAAALVFGVALSTRYWYGPGRALADRVPPWSLYRMQTGLMFLMLLVESGKMGRNLNTAWLLELARLSNPYVRDRIGAIARRAGNDPAGIGAAAMSCGNGWPAPALNTALAAYCRQENWLRNFSAYLDRWMERADERARAAAALANYILLSAVAGSLIGALLTIFGLLQEVQRGY